MHGLKYRKIPFRNEMMITPVTVIWKSLSLCRCLAPLLPTMIEVVQFLVVGHLLGPSLFVCLFQG